MMSCLSIRPINTGFVTTVPKEYLYHHSVVPFFEIPDDRIEMPDFVFLVEGGNELLLVDTGMSWTERADKYHHKGSYQPPGMSIPEQLAGIGYAPEDVGIIVFTHLHWDHCHYLDHFPGTRCVVHRLELEFALDPIPLYYKSYEHPALGITPPFQNREFEQVTGEHEIMPGVSVFETPGHSPGHMSLAVQTASGEYICAGDSIFTMDNLIAVPEIHYNISPPGRFCNIIQAWKSIELQKDRAQDPEHLLCSHDIGLISRSAKTPVLR